MVTLLSVITAIRTTRLLLNHHDASIPSLEEPLGLEEALPELAGDIEPVIKKVRKIVSKFRRSPVNNDLLQIEVALKFDKELRL